MAKKSTQKRPSHMPPEEMSSALFFSLLCVAILTAVVLHLCLYFDGFYSISADESGHTLEAHDWSVKKGLAPTFWLPFYRVIVGLALQLRPDLFTTPRIVIFLFGLSTLIGTTWLSFELFKSKKVTAIAAFLCALFPARVVLSLVPMAEMMYCSFIVAGMIFFARWSASLQLRDLLLASGSFILCSTVRYEGWIFAGCFAVTALIFVISRDSERSFSRAGSAAAVLLAASFPMFWIVFFAVKTGNPLGFVGEIAGRWQLVRGTSKAQLLSNIVVSQFAQQSLITFNAAGLISLAYWTREHRWIRWWVSVPAASLLVMSAIGYFTKGVANHNPWRVVVVWSLLLIPFTASWILQQGKIRFSSDSEQRLSKYTVICTLFFFLSLFGLYIYWMTRQSAFTTEDRLAGEYLNERLAPTPGQGKAKVLIETSDWSFLNIVVASQHPEAFVYNSGPDPFMPGEYIIDLNNPIDTSKLAENGIGLLVFRGPLYKARLQESAKIAKLKDIGYWSVYELRR